MGTVDDYLAGLDLADRETVTAVYTVARDVVPDAEQGTGYGMPALVYRGKPLLSVMRTKKHFGLYPFSPAAVSAAANQLEGCEIAKGTVRLAPGTPVPEEGIRQLVASRKAEIDSQRRAV